MTASSQLLNNRASIPDTNIRSPSEAAQILGLLLRSRDCYTYRILGNITCNTEQRRFYWVVSRYKLDSLWRYVAASASVSESLRDLALTVIERCSFALQARDKIGELFYEGKDKAQQVMYHFDYVSLLLLGAIDAQARIAYRLYQPPNYSEYSAGLHYSFDKKGNVKVNNFVKALKNHIASAQRVYKLAANDKHYQDIMILLPMLRNTIHADLLPTTSRDSGVTFGNQKESLVRIEHDQQPDLFRAVHDSTKRCGGIEKWGVEHRQYTQVNASNPQIRKQTQELLLEPFTFATTLIEECFGIINVIADSTDFSSKLPGDPPLSSGKPIPGDPNFELFVGATAKRFAVLG